MKKQILVEQQLLMTRIAMLQEGEWTNFYVASHLEEDMQNQVVIGQIEQVVKNLKAVFVNYGSDKNGLLHIKQIPECYHSKLHPGTRLPVQVVKQNVGEKGHKLTGKISLKGRFLVCLPFETGINVSKKIRDNTVRNQLKEVLKEAVGETYGFIVRTQAEEATIEQIIKDAKALMEKAKGFMATKDFLARGSVLYKEPPLYAQIINEELNNEDEIEIVCNHPKLLTEIESLMQEYGTIDQVKLTLVDEKDEIFVNYGLQKQLNHLTSRKVWLKNGGNLVIDYTEAMTIIDVNSAKAILTKNPRKAVLDLNLLATKESILQILRRNLAGIIIIDLVEMKEDEDKVAVYEMAKKLLAQYGDSRTKVYPLTELGLLQFSRTGKYTSLHHKLLAGCESCGHPYGEHNVFYELFLMEKQIKHVVSHTIQKQIVMKCTNELLAEINKYNLKSKLEAAYEIEISFEKMEKTSKTKFLCQFYSK